MFTRPDSDDRVVVLAEWDTAESANDDVKSDQVRRAMQEAGVGSKPDVTLLEDVECYRRLTPVDPSETASWGAEDGHYLDGCYVSARRNGDTPFSNLSFA